METYVEENIEQINGGIREFFQRNDEFTRAEVTNYLQRKFSEEIIDKKEMLLEEFRNKDFKRNKIESIANQNVFYTNDLEKFYDSYIYKDALSRLDVARIKEKILLEIREDENIDGNEYKFIKNKIGAILNKLLVMLKIGGFSMNIEMINQGIMASNSGDGSEFLFLARAILAGYNCSVVDVRSSKYDVIIDYRNRLLRVQVKGISEGKLYLKSRDRGGQGIDYTNERNRGRFISSDACDILVGVDKQCGVCYIIPIHQVETWRTEDKTYVSYEDIIGYQENWSIIQSIN